MRERTDGTGSAGRHRNSVGLLALLVLVIAMALFNVRDAEAQAMSSITVVLDTVPDDDQDFEFTASGAPLAATFTLDDDQGFAGSPDPSTLPEAWTSPLVPAGATYAITPTPVPGWNLASETCDNGDPPGAIVPDPGISVTCTFVYQPDPGVITVTKTAEDLTGTAWSFDIAIDPVDAGITSPQAVSGTGNDSDTVTFEPLTLNQTYTILEPSLPGTWTQTSFTCTVADEDPVQVGYQVTITSPAQDVSCDIVNSTLSAITVIVDAIPDDEQDFEFTTTGAPLPASILLDDDQNFAGSPDPNTLPEAWSSPLVPAGATYGFTPTPVPGWNLASETCDNGDPPGAIVPDPGISVTCTFVYQPDPGAISVTKTVQGADGAAWSFDIAIDPVDAGVTSPQNVSGTGDGADSVSFQPLALNQAYTILEPALPAGWEQTSLTCTVPDDDPATAGYQVRINDAGQAVACDIINTAVASITVILDVVPDGARDFEFTTTGAPLPSSFTLDDDQNFADSPDPNTLQNSWTSGLIPANNAYGISQTAVAGWLLTSASCDNGDSPDMVTLGPGENVTCTFINEATPAPVTRPVSSLDARWMLLLVLLVLLTALIQRRAAA